MAKKKRPRMGKPILPVYTRGEWAIYAGKRVNTYRVEHADGEWCGLVTVHVDRELRLWLWKPHPFKAVREIMTIVRAYLGANPEYLRSSIRVPCWPPEPYVRS